MHTRSTPRPPLVALLVLLALLASAAVTSAAPQVVSKPVPGIGIIVKKGPLHRTEGRITLPGGFLEPGSAPFDEVVPWQGRCSHDGRDDCDDGDPNAPDDRIDYVTETDAGPFTMSLVGMTLYSAVPLHVNIAGADSLFDVVITLQGQAPAADAPVTGSLALPPGVSLPVGSSTTVQGSTLTLRAIVGFTRASTGEPVGGTLTQDLTLTLQDPALPITRVDDGTLTGRILLGSDGVASLPFTYATADDRFAITLRSLSYNAPVPVHRHTWSSLKSRYR